LAEKKRRLRRIRPLVQGAFAAISNGHLIGFGTGKIYSGPLKALCSPGMNCYSCPGAWGACPIGALQAVLSSKQYRVALYVFGWLTVLGSLSGRLLCGFLCPFGWIQDLLFKIPFPKKRKRLPGERAWRCLRYAILAVAVLIFPALLQNPLGTGDPWFCKLLCPVGTLEAGIPLVLLRKELQAVVGILFFWKLFVLGFLLLFSVVLLRPFCRYLCPLGAIYGFFNRHALYRYRINPKKCLGCGACQRACQLEIPVWKNPNSMDCIRCGECRAACPAKAIETTLSLGKRSKEQKKRR